MVGMKNNQIYIGAAVLVAIVLGIVIWGSDGGGTVDETSETSTSTRETSQSTGATQNPRPTPVSGGTNVSSPVVSPTPPQVVAPVIPEAADLEGSIFIMTSYNGAALPSGERYILSFDNGYLSINLCNSISGRYIYDGNIIKADNLVSTKKFCSSPANVMEIETNFTSMLNHGALIYQSGNVITLVRTGVATMTFTGF